MKRPRFKIRWSRLMGLWYVFDRLTGTVLTAPTHDEALERCRGLAASMALTPPAWLANAATEPTA